MSIFQNWALGPAGGGMSWSSYWKKQSLFFLDGTILDVAGTKYFVDKSTNGRNFLITGYDFATDWTTGFPYKSAATISAPAADAALIAADINNFLYDAGGTPNQIPVVSLFQDIDYEHKIFCKHAAQVVDGNGVETYEPRVSHIFMATNVLAGADLNKAQTDFAVPEENTTTMAWISPAGNDTTGDGSKANPYATINKIKATTKTVVYIKTGVYTQTAMITFTGAEVSIIGTGLSKIATWSGLIGLEVNRDTNISHIEIDGTASTYGMYSNGGFINAVSVKSNKRIVFGAAKAFTYKNCVHAGRLFSHASETTASIDTCFVNGYTEDLITTIKNSKISQTMGSFTVTNFTGNTVKTAITAGSITNFKYNVCESNVSIGTAITTFSNNTVTGNVAGAGALGLFDANTLTGNITINTITTLSNNTITGNVTGTTSLTNFLGNTINGVFAFIATANMKANDNVITYNGNATSFTLTAAANANITGVEVKNNRFTGNRSSSYIVYVGTTANEDGANSINGVVFTGNKIQNNYVGAGTTHHLFIGGGIDNVIKYNELIVPCGFAIVIKSGGIHYTTTDAHVSYNVIKCTGNITSAILVKDGYGIIASNNTIKDFKNSAVFTVDTTTFDTLATFINNLVTLAGNTNNLFTEGSEGLGVSRNNSINKMGFTCTVGDDDDETAVTLDTNGVPSAAVTGGEEVAGDNNIGLASNYSIPDAITYETQDAEWQRGAVIL